MKTAQDLRKIVKTLATRSIYVMAVNMAIMLVTLSKYEGGILEKNTAEKFPSTQNPASRFVNAMFVYIERQIRKWKFACHLQVTTNNQENWKSH